MTFKVRSLGLACALAVGPCVREPAAQTTPTRTTTQSASSSPPPGAMDAATDVIAASDVVVPPVGLAGVIEAVRHEDWSAARTRLEQLSAVDQQTPEARYLAGRIAIERSDFVRAAAVFHGLSTEIPILAVDIQRLEASALSRAEQHTASRDAYVALANQTHAERDRAMAAEESLAVGDAAAAATDMITWIDNPPSGIERARAWRHAAQAFEATHDTARAVRAWKRILVDEPDANWATDAQAAVARLGSALTVDETLSRASHLNERARYDATINELASLSAGVGTNETQRLHLLGRAYYYARAHYAQAQTQLAAAAQRSDNSERDEDAFLAARSLSRSDRDDEAVAAYDNVAHTVHGRWSDEAAFRALWIVAHRDHIEATVERANRFLHDRTDATPQLRSDAAWEEAWALYNAGHFAEAAPAFEQSGTLASRALERGRGRYWSAMSRLALNDADGAVRGWQAIIADRPMTWYALLAEARLRQRGITVAPPADPAPRRIAPMLALPENVRFLRALGFDRDGGALLAAQEDRLRARLPHDRADEVMALAYMQLGEEFRAYSLAQRHNDLLDHEPTAETRWAWDCGYPRPHPSWVEAAEDANHLPRYYLYAIMRQESAFNPHDVSNARAIGLLQMIPPTTRHVAQELHIEYREEMLFEPAYNIRTGGYYIGRLFAQYRGVLPRAIGAFNAGPNAMGRWVTRWPSGEIDAFVERIPYDETRTYVRRVMQNLARYRYLNAPHGDGWPLQVTLTADPSVEHLVDY